MRPKVEITADLVERMRERLFHHCYAGSTMGWLWTDLGLALDETLNGERRKGDRRGDSPVERLRRGLTAYEKPPLGSKGAPEGASKEKDCQHHWDKWIAFTGPSKNFWKCCLCNTRRNTDPADTGVAPPHPPQDAARMSATDRRHCRIDDRPHGCARYFPHRRKDDPA